MLVKFFKPTKSKGATGALDYLLNAEGRETVPELLYGDPDITRQLLLASSFKNQYTAGCLSFAKEESDVSKEVQDELIQSFEAALLAGLQPNQYDILWIKHTDKDGRLELNFHVLNTELQTGKRLQPYLHQFDRPRIDTWKSLQNDVYELADPNAPERSRTLQLGNMKAVKPNNVKVAIHNHLEEMWVNGEINSRDEIINELNKIDGLEISRITPSAISIKVPDIKKPIRLKGELYNENIRTCQNWTEATENKQKRFDKEREQRIKANREKLNKLNTKCRKHRKEKYKYVIKAPEETKALIESVNADITAYNDSVNIRKPDLQENVRELRKRVSSMQNASSVERPKNTVLQDIESTNNKNNKESEHGKHLRDSARRIRANSIANRIIASRLQRNSQRLRELAKQVVKAVRERFRAKQLQQAKVERLGSDRDADQKHSESLRNVRERQADSRHARKQKGSNLEF
jgi:hypothetical protein